MQYIKNFETWQKKKIVPIEKFIAINAYISTNEQPDFTIQLTRKKGQTKPKVSRRKEATKIRA